METTKVDISDRLSAIRDELGLSQQDMGERVDISGQAWGKYERGKSTPSAHVLKLMVSNLGVDPHWLLSGHGEMWTSERYENGSAPPLEVRDKDLAHKLEDSGIEMHRVPQLRVEVDAGEGVEVYVPDEIEEDEEWLSAAFIRREYNVAPDKVRTLRVRGNSMKDTIEPGDRIRVALWDGERLWEGSVYVLHGPGGLTIKRYQGVHNGHVLLTADNPNVQDREVPQDRWNDEYRPVAWALEVTQPL